MMRTKPNFLQQKKLNIKQNTKLKSKQQSWLKESNPEREQKEEQLLQWQRTRFRLLCHQLKFKAPCYNCHSNSPTTTRGST